MTKKEREILDRVFLLLKSFNHKPDKKLLIDICNVLSNHSDKHGDRAIITAENLLVDVERM